ncbi:MAG TPA: ABC transporter permease [Methylomirabilota bacterium]|jgi:putative spermidine/putrescine transport system permease protein|nr:ABC transporter permease [Methylomirabilota bacterium]
MPEVTGALPSPARARVGHAAFWVAMWALGVAGLAYLLLPTLIIILASFTASDYIAFPPRGLSLRWFARLWELEAVRVAAWRSAWIAIAATALAVVLGVAAAFPLVRSRFPGREALNAFLMSPLILPSLVYGLAGLMFVSALGVPLSIPVLILSHVAIVVPYVVRTTAASLALLDPALEDAARSLGADAWRTFTWIVLPNLLPGIGTGAAFAFISSFDNLTVSLFLAGPRVETLPVRLFAMIQFDLDPTAAAISTALVLLALGVVLLAHWAVGLSRVVKV